MGAAEVGVLEGQIPASSVSAPQNGEAPRERAGVKAIRQRMDLGSIHPTTRLTGGIDRRHYDIEL